MDRFSDLDNSEEILQQIQDVKQPAEFQKLIDEFFPGWLLGTIDSYSPDYNYLQNNWERICSLSRTTPKKILLVEEIKFDPGHSTICKICEFLTRNGYCVRRAIEFLTCKVCGKAIPCKELWQVLKNNTIKVPDTWSNKCSTC